MPSQEGSTRIHAPSWNFTIVKYPASTNHQNTPKPVNVPVFWLKSLLGPHVRTQMKLRYSLWTGRQELRVGLQEWDPPGKAFCADQVPLPPRTHLRGETQSSDPCTHTVCFLRVPSHAVETQTRNNTSTETSAIRPQ